MLPNFRQKRFNIYIWKYILAYLNYHCVLTAVPVSPEGPFSPARPGGPTIPFSPGGPAGPTSPRGPRGPSFPEGPVRPEGPTIP